MNTEKDNVEKTSAGNLGDIFARRLSQLGIKRQVDAAMICEAFNESVLEVFGEKGVRNVKAISFKNNVLKVGVTSSAWANEVNLRQLELKSGQKMRLVYEQILDA